MRVIHLSTYDTKGGAAGSAYRLHGGLQAAGVESMMFVRSKQSDDDSVVQHEQATSWMSRFRRRLRREKIRFDFWRYQDTLPDGLELFSDDRAPYHLHDLKVFEPDILNLHWVANFVDYRHFFEECAGDTPVVWRLSDLNPFTGGCHYDQGCGKYKERCGACPQLGSTSEDDLSRAIWNRKREAFGALHDDQLHFVAPIEWIRDQVQASPLTDRFSATVIPNGLDVDLFRPRESQSLRSSMEIPSHHRIVLFVAQSTQNHRKGFDLLAESLSDLGQDDVTLLSIGGEKPELETTLSHLHLGTIESDLLLSVFYSLADLFVIPSRQDNLPNTVLESMACGTPVVGFDTGGIPDMVRPGKTGWLAEVGNVRDLRRAIERALENDTIREQRGRCAREVVEEEYTLERQAQQYTDLYRDILQKNEKTWWNTTRKVHPSFPPRSSSCRSHRLAKRAGHGRNRAIPFRRQNQTGVPGRRSASSRLAIIRDSLSKRRFAPFFCSVTLI
jgi:glycosyltransferase involved in cell wall biosynthesis